MDYFNISSKKSETRMLIDKGGERTIVHISICRTLYK